MRPKRRHPSDNVPNQPLPARILDEVEENGPFRYKLTGSCDFCFSVDEEDDNDSEEEYIPMEEDAVEEQLMQIPQAWVIVDQTQMNEENDRNLKIQKEIEVDKQLLSIARKRWQEDPFWLFKGDKVPLAKTKSVCQIPGQREDSTKVLNTMNAYVRETFKKIHNYSMRGKLPEEFYASVVIGHPLKIHKNSQRY